MVHTSPDEDSLLEYMLKIINGKKITNREYEFAKEKADYETPLQNIKAAKKVTNQKDISELIITTNTQTKKFK